MEVTGQNIADGVAIKDYDEGEVVALDFVVDEFRSFLPFDEPGGTHMFLRRPIEVQRNVFAIHGAETDFGHGA